MISTLLKDRLGAVTLVFTVVLLVLCTLLIIFAAQYGAMETKTTANINRDNQAFEAAEAGLEYGIAYLQTNYTTIIASPISGFIQPFTNSSVTNVALANGSYSIVFTNPTANDFTVFLVTATGLSDDGLASHTVSQYVKRSSILASPPSTPLTAKGAVTIGGNGTVTNLEANQTVVSGSTITLSGSGKTVTPTGVGNGSDRTANNSTINGYSSSDLFANYFGTSSANVKANATYYYNNTGSTTYSSTLNGVSGAVIWIDQTGGSAKINANTTIGTATNPVILVVNGDFDISGNVTINGLVFVFGKADATTDITGNVTINGALISADALGMTGNSNLVFNSTLLNQFSTSNATSFWARVPGSWKDF